MARCETDDTLALCVFAPSAEPLVAKVGLSAKSVERARANLYTEVGDADFDTVRERADKVWNDNLGRVTGHDLQRQRQAVAVHIAVSYYDRTGDI